MVDSLLDGRQSFPNQVNLWFAPSSTHGDADGDRNALSTYHDHILRSHHLRTAGLLVFRLDILLESEAGAR